MVTASTISLAVANYHVEHLEGPAKQGIKASESFSQNAKHGALDWSRKINVGNSRARQVLMVMSIAGNLSHNVFMALGTIKQETELTLATIRKAIQQLLDINAITEMPSRSGGVRRFRINVHYVDGVASLPGSCLRREGASKFATQNLNESKSIKKEDSKFDYYFGSSALPSSWGPLWQDYVKKRTSEGNRLTKSTANEFLSILRRLDAGKRPVQLILRDAIE